MRESTLILNETGHHNTPIDTYASPSLRHNNNEINPIIQMNSYLNPNT